MHVDENKVFTFMTLKNETQGWCWHHQSIDTTVPSIIFHKPFLVNLHGNGWRSSEVPSFCLLIAVSLVDVFGVFLSCFTLPYFHDLFYPISISITWPRKSTIVCIPSGGICCGRLWYWIFVREFVLLIPISFWCFIF